jgi:choline-glycine betaine transporter
VDIGRIGNCDPDADMTRPGLTTAAFVLRHFLLFFCGGFFSGLLTAQKQKRKKRKNAKTQKSKKSKKQKKQKSKKAKTQNEKKKKEKRKR